MSLANLLLYLVVGGLIAGALYITFFGLLEWVIKRDEKDHPRLPR